MKFHDLKIGEILLLSHGQYSDYQISTVVKVCREFNLFEITKLYGKKPQYAGFIEFINYLVQNHFVEEIAFKEWNVGGYKLFDGDSFTNINNFKKRCIANE